MSCKTINAARNRNNIVPANFLSTSKHFIMAIIPIAWLGLGASVQYAGVCVYFNIPIEPAVAIAIFMLVESTYLANKFTDINDSYNRPGQRMFFEQNKWLLSVPGAMLILSITLSVSAGIPVTVCIIVMASLGVLYNFGICIPKKRNPQTNYLKARDAFFVKNLLVSAIWGLGGFVMAFSQQPADISKNWSQASFLCIIVTFSAFINNIGSDIRDADADAAAGTKTLAVFLGRKNTARLIFNLVKLFTLSALIAGFAGFITKAETFYGILIIWYSLAAAAPYYLGWPKDRLSYIIAVDSQAIACGTGMIFMGIAGF